MATRTVQLSSTLNNAIIAEMDINDANWRPSKIRVINMLQDIALVITVRELGVVVWTGTANPNATTSWNISGIQLGWQPDYWNSITQQYEPNGIDLGNYTIQTKTQRI